jgi:hypothetical protein
MMAHAKAEKSLSHQSTSGTGGGARSEGPSIKPSFVLLAIDGDAESVKVVIDLSRFCLE